MTAIRGVPLLVQTLHRASARATNIGECLNVLPTKQHYPASQLPSRSLQLAALRGSDAYDQAVPLRALLVDAAGALCSHKLDLQHDQQESACFA